MRRTAWRNTSAERNRSNGYVDSDTRQRGFGSVPEGTTTSQTIQLKNTGTKSVTITGTSVSVAGSQYHTGGLTFTTDTRGWSHYAVPVVF